MKFMPFALMLVLAGCGTRIGPSAREICTSVGLTDAEFNAGVIATEASRDLEFTREENVLLATQICTSSDCLTCTLAIIDEVYR